MKSNNNTEPLAASVLASDNYSYREREWRAPSIAEGEEILFDEPGRVLDRDPARPGAGVDCRSHYYRVTKPKYGPYTLRVRHGGGEESCSLHHDKRTVAAFAVLDSDTRFRLLTTIMDVKRDAELSTRDRINANWRTAAAEKRVKTRKVRDGVKVWIVDPVLKAA